GGMGNIWGVLVGAAFLSYLNVFGLGETGSWINTHIHAGGWHPHIDAQLYQTGIYGVIILIVMLFRPEGLLPSRRRAAELHEGEPLQLGHPDAGGAPRGEAGARPRARAPAVHRAAAEGGRGRQEPAVRRPAPPRGGARACDRAEAALARRADGRDEPAGVRRVHGVPAQAARRARSDRADDRARHAGRDGRVRPRFGARLR